MTIQLSHGSGGKLSADLTRELLLPRFGNTALNKLEDQAVLSLPPGQIAFSTDSFVVSPLFFPGGDIGDLAVNGTVNDVAMSGGVPLYLSLGLIIEAGFAIAELERILDSIQHAAARAGVTIVTGDTKVVEKGSCDQLFINTSGIGVIPQNVSLGVHRIQAGDKILVSGTIGDHGMTILTLRNKLVSDQALKSDTAPLNGLIQAMLGETPHIHALRDPTRGGLATTMNEFSQGARLGMELWEEAIPVTDQVAAICDILGIDPLYVANEGKLVAIVAAAEAEKVLAAMRDHEYGRNAEIIGEVVAEHPTIVTIQTRLGAKRVVDMPIAEQLPRIC
jgi:hydrogenase expression/formation protein HypE